MNLQFKEEMLEDLISMINIPSVLDETNSEYPYGEDVNMALEKMLGICKKLGFKTFYNKHYGYAEIGSGAELIGVLGHLDVVPAGDLEKWNTNPYEAEVIDGKLYGRGTQDDKGPMLAAVYGVKLLMEQDITFNKRVRFIFGLDEENLWRSITEYLENEEKPAYGFTPDSIFPMINAEKGLLQAKIRFDKKSPITLIAGDAFNAVPDKAVYSGNKKEEVVNALKKLNYEYKVTENGIEVIGNGSHASKPQEGINAITRLVEALKIVGYKSSGIRLMNDIFANKVFGEGFIENCFDEVSGNLTINLGKVNFNENYQEICLDIRIPVTYEKEKVVKKLIDKIKEYGFSYEEHDFLASIYISEDNEMLQKLKKVFSRETGLDATPLSSGGATYARAIDNCLAYGALFPGDEKVEHKVNEYIKIENLFRCVDIYSKTIMELLK